MLISAFIFGLLGSFHCVGMCGPIAFLLPLDRHNKIRRIFQLASYHFGRLLTYAILGIIIGLLGDGFNFFGMQQHLSVTIGLLMIFAVLLPLKTPKQNVYFRSIYKAISKLKTAMGETLKKKTLTAFFTMGYLNGFLPCGLVYMAIFGALAMNTFWEGGLYMILFGLGTIPLMTSAIYLGSFLSGKIKQRLVKLVPIFVVVIGILFILRGLGLDVPYLSPPEQVSIERVGAEHSCHE